MTRPHHPKHDSKITAPPIQPSSGSFLDKLIMVDRKITKSISDLG